MKIAQGSGTVAIITTSAIMAALIGDGTALPYHPLWEKGYVSIGDVHTTKSLNEVDSEEETRFFGLTRECGLHDIDMSEVFLP